MHLNEFELTMRYVRPHETNLVLVNYNSILVGHAINLILNKRLDQRTIGMDIRY